MRENVRYAEVNFNDIVIEVDSDDWESEEEILKKAHVKLAKNFTVLVQEHIEVKVLPASVLTPETAFIGRLVRVPRTGRNGTILKINRQSLKAVTLLFTDGSTQIFDYHELISGKAYPSSFRKLQTPYKKGDPILPNKIYLISSELHTGLATITINRTRKHRATIHYLTTRDEPIKEYVNVAELDNLIVESN